MADAPDYILRRATNADAHAVRRIHRPLDDGLLTTRLVGEETLRHGLEDVIQGGIHRLDAECRIHHEPNGGVDVDRLCIERRRLRAKWPSSANECGQKLPSS